MANILCAWEFGGGLGHLLQLIPVAENLAEAGHNILLAVPEPALALKLIKRAYVERGAIKLVQGPTWAAISGINIQDVPMQSMADVLGIFDFANGTKLKAIVDVWDNIIHSSRADLIVADSAPTLRLAAGNKVPFVVIGNGYTIPPPHRRFPPIRPWESEITPSSRAKEDAILKAIHILQTQRSAVILPFVADLFHGDQSFICTCPEFDPYAAYRLAPPLRPHNSPMITKRLAIKDRQKERLFIYLPSQHPSLPEIFKALGRLKSEATAYIANADYDKLRSFAPSSVHILDCPARFEDVLGSCRILIHHAGLSTAYAAMQAGAPQILLPQNLEHFITARKVTEIAGGIGKNVSHDPLTANNLISYIEYFTNPASWPKIEAAANQIVPESPHKTLDAIIQNILCLLRV